MKKIFLLLLTALFVNGCGTSVDTISLPTARQPHPMNASREELQTVAQAAARSLMTDARFNNFLRKYKKEKNDPAAKPWLKVSPFQNCTEDPDFSADILVESLVKILLESDKIELSAAEGILRNHDVAASRKLQFDENFDMPSKRRLQAARLALQVKVSSNVKKTPDATVYIRDYFFSIIDINDGAYIWCYNKSIGIKR